MIGGDPTERVLSLFDGMKRLILRCFFAFLLVLVVQFVFCEATFFCCDPKTTHEIVFDRVLVKPTRFEYSSSPFDKEPKDVHSIR